jgi:hypothetical protein
MTMPSRLPDVAGPGRPVADDGDSADGVDGALRRAVAVESNEELVAGLEDDFRRMSAAQGRILVRLGEFSRRQAYRDEGATALEPWAVERFGVSVPTARALGQMSAKSHELPHLVGSLCAGEVSLDKVRALAPVATPESDRALCARAKDHSVHELADIARMEAEQLRVSRSIQGAVARPDAPSTHERRSVRFNDQCRTMTAQLPPASYAEVRSCLEARAKDIPSDGDTPWDQRVHDAFVEVIHSVDADARERSAQRVGAGAGTSSTPRTAGRTGAVGRAREAGAAATATTAGSPYVVVAHVPLSALRDEKGDPSEVAGELERGGLIDAETVERLACEATVIVALDDDLGHTMYEGRARRDPTGAQRREVRRRDRHCRFPGCTNVTFAHVHHIRHWKPDGRTDLANLALLCEFHHHRIHSKGWTMTGNANEELAIIGPTGRTMTSRPSPLWTRVERIRRMPD